MLINVYLRGSDEFSGCCGGDHALRSAPSLPKLQHWRRAQRDARTSGKLASAGAAALVGSKETYGSGKRCVPVLMSAGNCCVQVHAYHACGLNTRQKGMTSSMLSTDPFAGTAPPGNGSLAASSVASLMQSGQTELRTAAVRPSASEMLLRSLNVHASVVLDYIASMLRRSSVPADLPYRHFLNVHTTAVGPAAHQQLVVRRRSSAFSGQSGVSDGPRRHTLRNVP